MPASAPPLPPLLRARYSDSAVGLMAVSLVGAAVATGAFAAKAHDASSVRNVRAELVLVVPFLFVFGAIAAGYRRVGTFMGAAIGLGAALFCGGTGALAILVADGHMIALGLAFAIVGGLMYHAAREESRARAAERPPFTPRERVQGLAAAAALLAASIAALRLAGTSW